MRKSTGASSTPTGGQAYQKMKQRRDPGTPIQRIEIEPMYLNINALHSMKRSFGAMHPFKNPYMKRARVYHIMHLERNGQRNGQEKKRLNKNTFLFLSSTPPFFLPFATQLHLFIQPLSCNLVAFGKSKGAKMRMQPSYQPTYQPTYLPTNLPYFQSYLQFIRFPPPFLANILI